MQNKKVIIISACIAVLVGIGMGFNSLFSKADKTKEEAVVKEEIVSNKDTDLKLDLETKQEEQENKDKEKIEDIVKEQLSESTEEESEKNNNNENDKEEVEKPQNDIDKETNKDNNTNNNQNNNTTQEKPQSQTVTIAISCKTAIDNGLNSENGFTHLPSSGVILSTKTVEIKDGDTVFDVLQRTVRENNIHMASSGSGSSLYIEGIHNLYEFDGGANSGWMYSVNGWYPNYGAGGYKLKANDVIKWNYTCDLGADLGASRN